MFDRADTTKSGTLTLAELKAAFCRVDPLLPDSAVEEIMSMLDLEAVGSVSFEEVGPSGVSFLPSIRSFYYARNILRFTLFCRHRRRLTASGIVWFMPG